MAGMCSALIHPTAGVNRRLDLSLIDTLIHLVVRCRLCRETPARLDVHLVIHLRTAVRPLRWPLCRHERVSKSAMERPFRESLRPPPISATDFSHQRRPFTNSIYAYS